MANPLMDRMHAATGWSIALSVLMIIAGLLAIFVPFVAGIAVTAIVGWLLIFTGAMHIALAWRARTTGSITWEVLLGIVYGAIGFFLLARPIAGLATLTFALAIYLVVEAILEFALWGHLRPARGSGWVLFDAIVTLVLAIMIWSTWPSSAVWVLGTIVGLSIFFSGISRLMLSLAARRMVA